MAMFGFGQQDPYAEAEQAAQDRQTAFAGMKDNLPALGLIAGLSMLARNNGTRSVGQLIGQAGGDALNAYSTFQKMEEARKRQKQLDEERAEERDYARSQDALRNDMAERKFGLEQAKMAQDMALARQRMGIEGARLALARQAAAAGDYTLSNVNGVPVLVDKKTGELRQLTPEQLQQMQAAGGAMGANTPMGEAFAKEMAKKGADEYTSIQKAGMSAQDTIAKMDQVDTILNSGLYTGPGGDFVQSVRKAGVALGMSDPIAAANAETLQKIGNELALMARNPDSGMGMPGAMSDKDREFLVSMQPGLDKSVEGNRMLVEATRRVAQRKIELARMAGEYRRQRGFLDDGFYDIVREYSKKNPMFGDLGGKKNRKPLDEF